MRRERIAFAALRAGAAFAFLYPAVSAVFDPVSWLGYFPHVVRALPAQIGFPVDPLILLHGFGALEVILAFWILFGKNIRIPAVVATLMLLAIVAFNWTDMDVVFRDISISLMTGALALLPEPLPS